MDKIAGVKTLLSSSVAGLTLILLATNPSLANTPSEKATLNQAQRTFKQAELVKQLLNQRTTPRNPTTQQTKQMECACCKSMMNNMLGKTDNMPSMMHNMPRMMDGQNK